MKKALILMLLLCMIFMLAACTPDEKGPYINPNPLPHSVKLLYAKTDVPRGAEMNAKNIDTYFSSYTTNDATAIANGILYENRYEVLAGKWTVTSMPGGTIANQKHFTDVEPAVKAPEPTEPKDPEADLKTFLLYFTNDCIYMDIPANKMIEAMPAAAQRAQEIHIRSIHVIITGKKGMGSLTQSKEYTIDMHGKYSLKGMEEIPRFTVTNETPEGEEFQDVLYKYATFIMHDFEDPRITVQGTVIGDGAEYTFEMYGKLMPMIEVDETEMPEGSDKTIEELIQEFLKSFIEATPGLDDIFDIINQGR